MPERAALQLSAAALNAQTLKLRDIPHGRRCSCWRQQ
jgi:hypothetical protein